MKTIYIPTNRKPINRANYLLGGFKTKKEKTDWLREIYKRMKGGKMNKLKVVYTGGLDTKLDKKITKFFTELGFDWYYQEMEIKTQEREIGFEKNT